MTIKRFSVAEIRAVFAKRRRIQANAVPADGELFNLEVDYDVDPMSVVTKAGYNAYGWKYLGSKLSGERTLQAKLIRLGYVRNLEEARKKADKLGFRFVEGQAREPFRVRFPNPDYKGPVVFGGSEWQDPDGRAHVLCLYIFAAHEWHSGFYWSDVDFYGSCRWLVVGK